MEGNEVQVRLWGRNVGLLYWDEKRNVSIFQFNRGFIRHGLDIAPITAPITSLALQRGFPLQGNPQRPYHGLPEFIADSLPDEWGDKMFKSWLESSGLKRRNITPVDRLSFIGKRAMGALEYYPAHIEEDASFDIKLSSLYELADRLFSERQDVILDIGHGLIMEDLYKVGTSAGGHHPKAIIAIDGNTGTVRSGQADLPPSYKHYILKFDMSKPDGFPFTKVEMAYYLMAKDAGIDMMPSHLMEIDGRQHFITQRFDRENGMKLHTQTMAAMSPLADSYEDLFLIGRKLRLTAKEQYQQFRRAVFNVLASNVDDHQKNFSFTMLPNGKWTLSPAYDMIFSVAPDTCFNRSHELTVTGKRNDITRQDLLHLAQSQDIRNASKVIDEISNVVVRFREYAERTGINDYWIRQIENVLKENEALKGLWPNCTAQNPAGMTYRCSNGKLATNVRIVRLGNNGFRLYTDIDGIPYQYNFSRKNEVYVKLMAGKLSLEERNKLIETYILPKAAGGFGNRDNKEMKS